MSQKYMLSPLTSMRCTKTILRPGMASYRKSSLASHSVMEMCYSCFMDTKYKYLTLGAIAVVSDTMCSELYVIQVFSFYFSQLIAKVRPDEHCISSFRQQLLAVTSSASSE